MKDDFNTVMYISIYINLTIHLNIILKSITQCCKKEFNLQNIPNLNITNITVKSAAEYSIYLWPDNDRVGALIKSVINLLIPQHHNKNKK